MKPASLFLFIGLLLAACAPAVNSGEPTATPPTPVGQTATEAAPPAAGVIYGRNDDGTFFHGATDAPVTFIDYSDFL